MNEYANEIEADEMFEGSTVDIINSKTIQVVTKEGYNFKVTREDVEYLGKGEIEIEEPEIPELQEGDITFTCNPTTPTNGDVEVTIETKIELGENWIEYSINNGALWIKYENPITVDKNGKIEARISNNAGSSVNTATQNVTNIDKLAPNEPTLGVTGVTENSITVVANAEDRPKTNEYASSGIKGYQFSKDNGSTWEPTIPQASGTYTFSNLTAGTSYTLKVKAIDNANNETEITNEINQKTESKEISAGDLANSGSTFGAEVKGYECQNSVAVNKWLLFYADENNIYLIANDYITYESIPNSSEGNKPNKGTLNGAAYFNNILNDYKGSDSITKSDIKELNSSYFSVGFKSTSNNMKAVAYMLDTNVWSGFTGEKAEYSIGCPTLELFFNSYNKKYKTNYKARASSVDGYLVSNDNGSSWNTVIRTMISTNDTTYISKSSNATGLWIASPSFSSFNCLFSVYNTGDVIRNG